MDVIGTGSIRLNTADVDLCASRVGALMAGSKFAPDTRSGTRRK